MARRAVERREGTSRLASVRPWQVVLPVGLGTSLSLVGDATLYTVLPTHTAQASVLLAQVGILLSANRWIRLVGNNVGGYAYDRLPRRPLFILSLLVGAISTASYVLFPGFWPMLLGRLAWGLAWVGIWIGGNTIILDVAREHNRGKLVGVYQMAYFLGAAFGSVLGGGLTDLVGYHGAMAVAAALTFLGMVVAFFVLPETRSGVASRAAEAVETGVPASNHLPWADLLSATALLAVYRLVIPGMLIATFNLFLDERFGPVVHLFGREIGVATVTGAGLGLSTLVSLAFAPLAGAASDRSANRWRVVGSGVLPGIAGFGLLAWGLPWSVGLGLPLTSVSSGSNQSLATTLIGDLASQRRRGRSLGLLYTVGDLGSAIGPPLAYNLLIPGWGVRGVYWFSAAILVLPLAIALWRGRTSLPWRVTPL